MPYRLLNNLMVFEFSINLHLWVGRKIHILVLVPTQSNLTKNCHHNELLGTMCLKWRRKWRKNISTIKMITIVIIMRRKKHRYYIGKHIRFTEPNQKINKCVYNWIAKILAFVSKCEWKWNENRIKSFQFSHSYIFFYSSLRAHTEHLFFIEIKSIHTHTHTRTVKFLFCECSTPHFFKGYCK